MTRIKNKIMCEIYSRPVGFIRPVNQWNPGKTEEFKRRKMLNITKSLENFNEIRKDIMA